jgi:Na+/H+-dicarboxylate symporter
MKKIPLVAKILIGFVSGTAIGLGLSAFCEAETVKKIIPYISPFGSILVAMLKAVVYPIILFSLIAGAACLPLKRSGKVGGIVMAWYFVTSLFATLFGVALAYMLNPSISGAANVASANMASAKEIAGSAVSGTITALITGLFQNPFAALSSGQFLPVIVFAIAFGLASRSILDSLPEESEVARGVRLFVKAVEGAQHISFRLIDWVVCYFPIGVFALSLTNFAANGTLLFGPYLRITCCVIVGVFAMMFLIYPLAILVFCRQNPYKILLRIKDAMLTAFVTRSSAATLPVSFRAMDGLGVDRAISGFSLPMGSTVNMDGVCVHLPVFVILAANMFGHDLSMLQIATLCISIMFASIGAGGVPGGSVFLLFMVLENMGLPADQVSLVVALALGINPILDMFETCCNVAGDNVCTYIVARKNGLIKDPE